MAVSLDPLRRVGATAYLAACTFAYMLANPLPASAALESAAGGAHGTGGFAKLTRYLDAIANDLVPVGGALAVLGLIYGGSLLMAGAPHAGRTLTYVVVGVVIVLGSQGLAK